jgi:hypothetical protein
MLMIGMLDMGATVVKGDQTGAITESGGRLVLESTARAAQRIGGIPG